MTSVATIYALLDPNTDAVRYVGVTCRTPEHRLGQHLSSAKRHQTRCARWIRKLLKNGAPPKLLVLERGVPRARELYWIAHYRSRGADLTNLTDGGEGAPGWKPTTKTRRAIAKALLGHTRSEASRKKQAATMLGMTRPASTREKMGAHQRGKKKSEMHRGAIAAARKTVGAKQREAFMSKAQRTALALAWLTNAGTIRALARAHGVGPTYIRKVVKEFEDDRRSARSSIQAGSGNPSTV